MPSRNLTIITMAMAVALAMSGCAVSDAGPSEFSINRITVANPITSLDEQSQ